MAQQAPKSATSAGLKKRQLIANANQSMFVWVAIASVAVSVCIVSAQFLVQKWDYTNHILGAKYKAADQLKKNITSAKQLQDAVNALVSNNDLASVKTVPSDPNTKSILDALPSKFDPTAFATSLQQAILNRSGVTIEGISVPSDQAPDTTTGDTTADPTPQEMKFSVTVNGSYDKIRNMMLDFERTIRPIKITAITLDGNDAAMNATISGVTYYQLSKSADVKQGAVK